MRVVEKAEALSLLEANRRELGLEASSCIVCGLLNLPARDASLLGQTEHGVVLLVRFAVRRGHLMVCSKRCLTHPAELGLSAFLDLQALLWGASVALERALKPTRTFLASLGATVQLPMTAPHFHFHALPLFETGEETRPANVFSWSKGLVLYDDDREVAALRDELLRAWPSQEVPLAPPG